MKFKMSVVLSLHVVVAVLLASMVATAGEIGRDFTSPDGRVGCVFEMRDGHVALDFAYGGRRVGSIGYESRLYGRYSVIGTEEHQVKTSWKPVWGTAAEYPERYTERRIRLTSPGADGRETMRLEIRAYDEGVAVRYVVQSEVYGENEQGSEGFAASFVPNAVCWAIPETEATYPENPQSVAALSRSRHWRMPLTLRTPDGVHASLLEAQTVDWPRSYLIADGKGGFTTKFVHGTKCGRGAWTSPWRAVILAPSAGGLIERAHLVQSLSAPCALAETAWLRPGLAVSDVYNCEFHMDEVIAAAKEAKKIGAKYLQLDWGWYGTEYAWSEDDLANFLKKNPQFAADPTVRENVRADPFTPARGTVPYHPWWGYLELTRRGVDLDLPKLVAALKPLDMGLCLYVHGSVLEGVDLERLFATYESWGVAGLKPGFVAYGSQRATEWLRRLADVAARHHLWLDIHDQLIPDGFDRTWPNVFICEGGGGEEGHHPVHQDVVLPFTRCLAGPFDYTPHFFNAKRTHAHAPAFLICYPGPTAIMRGSVVKALAADPKIFDFVRALPWTYDETRVLGGEIAKYLVVARRRGADWFIGGMNGREERAVDVPTDFLPAGTSIRLLTDGGERTIRAGEPLRIAMKSGGGFVGWTNFRNSAH